MIYNLFNDFYTINREFENFFNSGFQGNRGRWPEVNVYEDENGFTAVAKLAGVDKNDVSITYKENELTLSGEKKSDEKGTYHLNERSNGKFERKIILKERIDTDNISASMENGLLTVKLPKSPEAKPKSIAIN